MARPCSLRGSTAAKKMRLNEKMPRECALFIYPWFFSPLSRHNWHAGRRCERFFLGAAKSRSFFCQPDGSCSSFGFAVAGQEPAGSSTGLGRLPYVSAAAPPTRTSLDHAQLLKQRCVTLPSTHTPHCSPACCSCTQKTSSVGRRELLCLLSYSLSVLGQLLGEHNVRV